MHEVQTRRVGGPSVYRMLGLVVLAVLLVAGGAVVFAGKAPSAGSNAVGLAADASQDPNASAAPAASTAPDASQAPGKGPGGRGGFGRGGFFGGFFGGPGGPGPLGGGLMPDGRHAITISGIAGTTLALETDDGWSRTIETSGAKITREGTDITLADLKVGDAVRFAETRNDDGTYTITEIAVVLPRVAGTATALGADTITLSQRDGSTQTIHIGTGTTFNVPGVTSPTIADVKVGNLVEAAGSLRADGSLDATSVVVFNGDRLDRGGRGPGGRGPGGRGPGGGNPGDPNPPTDPNASPAPSTAPAG